MRLHIRAGVLLECTVLRWFEMSEPDIATLSMLAFLCLVGLLHLLVSCYSVFGNGAAHKDNVSSPRFRAERVAVGL